MGKKASYMVLFSVDASFQHQQVRYEICILNLYMESVYLEYFERPSYLWNKNLQAFSS